MNYPDIFFTEEYSNLFKDTAFGGEPCHFNAAGIDYRFYRRPIEGTPYFDIASPYGYSGPLALENNASWPTFLKAFHQYCQEQNIIAEFARLHPYLENHQYLGKADVRYEHDVVYIDLTQSETEIWKGFDKGCRGVIKKATHDPSPFIFRQVYEQRMKAINANPDYLFTDRFWQLLPAISFQLSVYGAGCILLLHGDYCHYFLSAARPDGNTNAMLWQAIKGAKSSGFKIFNLGGGLTAEDSLESFKRSFSHTTKPFFTYRKIHDQEVYNKLCQDKGIDPQSDGYFPAYRR